MPLPSDWYLNIMGKLVISRKMRVSLWTSLVCLGLASVVLGVRVLKYQDKLEVLPIAQWGFGTSKLVFNSDGPNGTSKTVVYGHSVKMGPFRLSSFNEYGLTVMRRYTGR